MVAVAQMVKIDQNSFFQVFVNSETLNLNVGLTVIDVDLFNVVSMLLAWSGGGVGRSNFLSHRIRSSVSRFFGGIYPHKNIWEGIPIKESW